MKFLFLPDGEDPASLLETETKQEFEQRAQSSLMLSEYFVQRLSNAVGTGSLEKKAKLATQATALLKTMPESSIKLLLQSEVNVFNHRAIVFGELSNSTLEIRWSSSELKIADLIISLPA